MKEVSNTESLKSATSNQSERDGISFCEEKDVEAIGDMIVEESGPVEYCEELEEGIGDHELEQLAYEGDPLLQSDYEDEGTCISVIFYIYPLNTVSQGKEPFRH